MCKIITNLKNKVKLCLWPVSTYQVDFDLVIKAFFYYERNNMKAGILLGGSLLVAVFSFPAFAEKEVSYKNDVFPVFQDYCLSCHVPGGKGYTKSGFDLRTYKSLMKGTKFGPVVQPGSSLTSTLNVLVSGHSNSAISMPYGIKGGLPKDKSSLLNIWVDQGAKDN